MRIPFGPVTVEGQVCSEAVVSVAVSSTVAMRVVPVDAEGVEHPDAAVAVVGGDDVADVAAFLSAVRDAAIALLDGRGV
jgi:hypothetical protein